MLGVNSAQHKTHFFQLLSPIFPRALIQPIKFDRCSTIRVLQVIYFIVYTKTTGILLINIWFPQCKKYVPRLFPLNNCTFAVLKQNKVGKRAISNTLYAILFCWFLRG